MSLIVAGSRTVLQMSEDRMLPPWIGGLSGDSPKLAVLLIGAGTAASLFLGNLKFIALASNFGVIFSYAMTGMAVVIFRRRKISGMFQSPLYPWVQVVSLVLSVVVMLSLGVEALYLGAISILIGFLIFGVMQVREKIEGRDPAR